MKFITQKEFDEIISKQALTYEKILYSFDGIIHLETVAKKFPELYTTKNNKARMNDISSAIERDNKLLEAYKMHQNRVIISSCRDINEKKENVIEGIQKILNHKMG